MRSRFGRITLTLPTPRKTLRKRILLLPADTTSCQPDRTWRPALRTRPRCGPSAARKAAGPWTDTGSGTANTPPSSQHGVPFSGGTFPVGTAVSPGYEETGPRGCRSFSSPTPTGLTRLTYSASAEKPALIRREPVGRPRGVAPDGVTLLNQGAASGVNYEGQRPLRRAGHPQRKYRRHREGRPGKSSWRTPRPARRWATRLPALPTMA